VEGANPSLAISLTMPLVHNGAIGMIIYKPRF
jgi:hypothetical protein